MIASSDTVIKMSSTYWDIAKEIYQIGTGGMADNCLGEL